MAVKVREYIKVNKIYTIMVMADLTYASNTKLKSPVFGAKRIVGWYSEFEDAYLAVSKNICDINETCYQYALIEECEEGLYNPETKRWWFEYNREKISMYKLMSRGLLKDFVDLL